MHSPALFCPQVQVFDTPTGSCVELVAFDHSANLTDISILLTFEYKCQVGRVVKGGELKSHSLREIGGSNPSSDKHILLIEKGSSLLGS